ncbi:hypothetical protein NX023_05350 [Cytobacillus firmus]|nr:hypothetical protein [Cytobacillus firmus]
MMGFMPVMQFFCMNWGVGKRITVRKWNFFNAVLEYRPEIKFIRALRQVYQSEFKYIGYFAKDIGQNMILSVTFLRISVTPRPSSFPATSPCKYEYASAMIILCTAPNSCKISGKQDRKKESL